jgi:hypothetical protein
MIENTPVQIAHYYSAAMDSVALINAGKPISMSAADWNGTVSRNKEHLKIMIAETFWTTEDLAPMRAASI